MVHFQNDIIEAGSAFGSLFREEIDRVGTIGKANSLAGAVRSAGGKVIWVRIALEPDYADSNPRIPLLGLGQQAKALVNLAHGTEISREADVKPDDVVVRHTRPNPFLHSALSGELAGRDTVLVAGVGTNASVETTFRHAADLDYRAVLADDASSAAAPEVHGAAVESMKLFGEIATVEDIAAALA